jgi:hypothetical protein
MIRGSDIVSVIIPAFNAQRTLDSTLRSVRGQTYRNLEIVVIDDGSVDDTAEISRRHAAEDQRIRLISIQNSGVANARNAGIAATRGAFIAPIDADDLWHPDKITYQMRAIIEAGTDVGYVYCLSRRIDGQDRILHDVRSHTMQGRTFLRSVVYNPVGNGSSILARRSALEEIGGFCVDPEIQGAEDNLVQIEMSRNWLVCAVALYLTGYRTSADSLSANFERMLRCRFSVLNYVRQRFPETPAAVLNLAEGRLRAVVAAEAFRRGKLAQGTAELARACRLAPLIGLEMLAVDWLGRIRRRALGSIRDSFHGGGESVSFLNFDPSSSFRTALSRSLERRQLAALANTEEEFFNAAGLKKRNGLSFRPAHCSFSGPVPSAADLL